MAIGHGSVAEAIRILHKHNWPFSILVLENMTSAAVLKRCIITIAVIILALLVSVSSASNTCDSSSPNKSCAACSDAKDLQRRVALALDQSDGVSLTDEGRSLRATVEDVLSKDECQFLVDKLPLWVFKDAGGYESTSNKYNANRKGYSGIGLTELSKGDHPILPTKKDYETFLEFRERVRAKTEESLNLCPGTLKIDYTHISQKTAGGAHRPHADNCFHYFRDTKSGIAATFDETKKHPYSNRVAASILYLNDDGFDGGEFYWASRSSEEGTPETTVPPRGGRMTVFTSGVENLHGALPVRDTGDASPSRRLALAMWYVASGDPEEKVPEYGHSDETEEEADPNRILLFEIPVESIKIGSLRLALGLFLVGKQNTPSPNSWRANQANESTLHMIFRDQSAMISITLKPSAIIVNRHTDGIRSPSLVYQLQESVLLHGVLTEIETLAFGEDGAESRLIELDRAAIEKARSTLPTR